MRDRVDLRRHGMGGATTLKVDGTVERQRLEVVGDEAHQVAEVDS